MANPLHILPFHQLLLQLEAQGFWFGMDTRYRLADYWDFILQKKEVDREALKYQLSALLCKSAEDQERFSVAFDTYFPDFEHLDFSKKEEEIPEPALKYGEKEKPQVGARPALPITTRKIKPRKIVFNQGPILPPLTFPENPLRVWNLSQMSRTLVGLQEKIWMDTTEWDIPVTIRQTIRSGGFPKLKYKKKKRAPRYLALIEQWHPRDHLAGFAADLMLEMNRRDLETDFYFYSKNPARCWKNLNNPRSHVYLEYLKSEWDGARILLIGSASNFVDALTGKPTPIALDFAENWGEVALLTTNSVLEWAEPEMTLQYLFPLAPLSLEGLDSLMQQWNTDHFLSIQHWLQKYPEPVPPNLIPNRERSKDDIVLDLFRFLQKDAFRWMCATMVYPEVYYKMTAHLHDEAIPRQAVLSEWEQNEIWHQALRLISKLEWYRLGYVPETMRENLRQRLSAPDLATVETEIRRILDWAYNAVDADSNAFRERKAMYDWLAARSFRILWIDDHPENNTFFQNRLSKELGLVIKNAMSTPEAISMLADHFDLILSDIGRQKEENGGLGTMEAIRSRSVEIPVIFFTNTRGMNLRGRLLEAGALEVTNNYETLEILIKERMEWKFGKGEEETGEREKRDEGSGADYADGQGSKFGDVETGAGVEENMAQQSQQYEVPETILEEKGKNELPEFSSLEELKAFLKESISSGDLEVGLDYFEQVLPSESELRTDLIALRGRFNLDKEWSFKKNLDGMTASFEEQRIKFSFLELVAGLKEKDLKAGVIRHIQNRKTKK